MARIPPFSDRFQRAWVPIFSWMLWIVNCTHCALHDLQGIFLPLRATLSDNFFKNSGMESTVRKCALLEMVVWSVITRLEGAELGEVTLLLSMKGVLDLYTISCLRILPIGQNYRTLIILFENKRVGPLYHLSFYASQRLTCWRVEGGEWRVMLTMSMNGLVLMVGEFGRVICRASFITYDLFGSGDETLKLPLHPLHPQNTGGPVLRLQSDGRRG